MTPARARACAIAVLLGLGLPAAAAAQTVNDARAWFDVIAQQRPQPETRWVSVFEGIAHSRDMVRTRDLFGTRATLLRRLSARTTLGGGYLYSRAFAASGGVVVEHRVFGQFVTSAAAPDGLWTFRTRVEARFIDGNGGEVTRLRQMLRYTHPWRPRSRLAVTGYEELLVHANGAVHNPRGVDQNRLFAGVSIPVTSAQLEVGYLNDLVPGHGHALRVSHILSAVFAVPF